MTSIETIFHNLGFSDKEMAIYLALLQRGSAPASVLAKLSHIPRTTAKFTCEQLRKRNIIQSTPKGNSVIYSIDTPERLHFLIDQQKEKLEQKESALQNVMGDLKNMMNPYAVLPKIHFFEGIEGVKKALETIIQELKTGDEIVSFVKVFNQFNDYPEIKNIVNTFLKKRISKNISTRVLGISSPEIIALQKQDSKHLRETRIIPSLDIDFPGGEIFLYKNTVYSMTSENGIIFGFYVQSPSIYAMIRSLFETAWNAAS